MLGEKAGLGSQEIAARRALGPADLQSAYQVPVPLGAGTTIAIVDAFDDPNAESDLATYRANYGLPPCTTANGCFRKLNPGAPREFPVNCSTSTELRETRG